MRRRHGVDARIVVLYDVRAVRPTAIPLIRRIYGIPRCGVVFPDLFHAPGVFKSPLVVRRVRFAVCKDLLGKRRAATIFPAFEPRR